MGSVEEISAGKPHLIIRLGARISVQRARIEEWTYPRVEINIFGRMPLNG